MTSRALFFPSPPPIPGGMDTKPVAAWRRCLYWLVVVAALAAAWCWGATRESVLGRLPAGLATWIRSERAIWCGSSWPEWLGREAATWREIAEGPEPVRGAE